MPTYEYRCPNGHEFDHFFRKISDATPSLSCPQCGAQAERLISGGAGLLFRGSGFYITDYGKDGKKEQKGAAAKAGDGGAGGAPATGGEAKPSESKPAAADAAAKPTPSKPSSSSGGGGGSSAE